MDILNRKHLLTQSGGLIQTLLAMCKVYLLIILVADRKSFFFFPFAKIRPLKNLQRWYFIFYCLSILVCEWNVIVNHRRMKIGENVAHGILIQIGLNFRTMQNMATHGELRIPLHYAEINAKSVLFIRNRYFSGCMSLSLSLSLLCVCLALGKVLTCFSESVMMPYTRHKHQFTSFHLYLFLSTSRSHFPYTRTLSDTSSPDQSKLTKSLHSY